MNNDKALMVNELHQQMVVKGERFARLLKGWRLIGVDPGYLFTRSHGGYGSLDLPEDVIDSILERTTF